MSHAVGSANHATLADYLAFFDTRPEHERWELIDGVIEMMTNPTERHGLICGNIFAPLKLALDGSGCRVFAGSLRVQRSDDRDEDMATIPDVLVRCGPRREQSFATDPTIVVEVLSPSTAYKDRGSKFDFYRRLPSLQHIVLVYQDQMRIEHYRRVADGWNSVTLRRPSDRLVLNAVDVAIDLDTVYFDVPVLRPSEPPEGYEDDVPILIP